MNGSVEKAWELAKELASRDFISNKMQVVVFPSFLHIPAVLKALRHSHVKVGAQNFSAHNNGAHTGEISAEMLVDVGCSHVLVGHSERRTLHQEDDVLVAEKYATALDVGLIPILCVGESLIERQTGESEDVVRRQILCVKERVGLAQLCSGVIAYEPVWAIGTGRSASPSNVQKVHASVRNSLGEAGSATKILYGGSLTADNAKSMFAIQDVDGGLIGGASLRAQEFSQIIKLAEETQ